MDEEAEPNTNIGQVNCDRCCERAGVCAYVLRGSLRAWLDSLDCFLHFFRAQTRSTLQDASRMFCIVAKNAGGSKHTFWHMLVTDADDDPKFTIFGIRCPVRRAWRDRIFADGSPPEPPFELELATNTFHHGPPGCPHSSIELCHFLSAPDVVHNFLAHTDLPMRTLYELQFSTYLDRGPDTLAFVVHSSGPSIFWWKNCHHK